MINQDRREAAGSEPTIKYVRRDADGLVYTVHGQRPIIIAKIHVGAMDYLITTPKRRGDDLMESDMDGLVWVDGFSVGRVVAASSDDITPDVP